MGGINLRVWELSEQMPQYEEPQFIGLFLTKELMEEYMKNNSPNHDKTWVYHASDFEEKSGKILEKNQEIVERLNNRIDELDTFIEYAKNLKATNINTYPQMIIKKELQSILNGEQNEIK